MVGTIIDRHCSHLITASVYHDFSFSSNSSSRNIVHASQQEPLSVPAEVQKKEDPKNKYGTQRYSRTRACNVTKLNDSLFLFYYRYVRASVGV